MNNNEFPKITWPTWKHVTRDLYESVNPHAHIEFASGERICLSGDEISIDYLLDVVIKYDKE